LDFFSGRTRDPHHRKNTGRQQPAAVKAINAINLLKKKNSSMTSPNAIVTP
jgi:hypothetical protein